MRTVLLIFLILISLPCLLVSQDIIFKADKDTIAAKVLTIGLTEVEFKKSDYLDGPLYVISKKDIDSIKFANGAVDHLIKLTAYNNRPDTIIYSIIDAAVVDTIIIQNIKFYLFKSASFSYNKRHDLRVDFTHYNRSNFQTICGAVSFVFDIKNKNFIIHASINSKVLTIPFRFISEGSMRRFKKLCYNPLNKIEFMNSEVELLITPEFAKAFMNMFEAEYMRYESKLW